MFNPIKIKNTIGIWWSNEAVELGRGDFHAGVRSLLYSVVLPRPKVALKWTAELTLMMQ